MKKPFVEILACQSGGSRCAVQPATHADLPATVKTVAPATGASRRRRMAWMRRRGGRSSATRCSTNWWTSVLTGNLDLQAAAERVKQAQAVTTQKHAVLLPELDATATASDRRRTRRRRLAMYGRVASVSR